MPFGKYTICLVDTAPSPDEYLKFTYDNTRAERSRHDRQERIDGRELVRDELRRMTRLRDERGMTLPEVLVSVTIAMIISLATFALIETVMRRAGDISARVDSTQRGRVRDGLHHAPAALAGVRPGDRSGDGR